MSEKEKKAAEQISKYLPLLNDYNKGRFTGIAEGLAMAMEAKEPDNKEAEHHD